MYNITGTSSNAVSNLLVNTTETWSNSGKTSTLPNVLRTRRFQTNLVEIHEQKISVPCELNNGIKELNNEIKILYESLTRLDARVNNNRRKRGMNETVIVDCVQMKGKFKQIYDDLNQIFETLSMIDEKGICRCVCPLNKITSTTEVTKHNTTDFPFDLTTFALQENPINYSSPDEQTKQLKKYLVSRTDIREDNFNDKFKNITDIEIATENDENQYTSALEYTALEETVTTTETKEDMSPEMSNAVTNIINLKNFTQTVAPQLQTFYGEVFTKDYEQDGNIFNSAAPELSSTMVTTDSNEISDTTIPAEKDIRSDENVHNNIPYSTMKISDFYENNFLHNPIKLTSWSENISESNENFTDKTLKLTSVRENIIESTTEMLNIVNENNNTIDNDRITNGISELMSENEHISTFGTEISSDEADENIDNTRVMDRISELTSENENIVSSSTTVTSISRINAKSTTVNVKERTSLEDRDKSHLEKTNVLLANRWTTEKTNIENDKNSRLYDQKSTLRPEIIIQQQVHTKWTPMCFYPVPCSPVNYQQNTQNSKKGPIQYSAQSLNTYKNKSPLADATVIQNNYPILTYCPMGMVCPMTDFAGQANVLHCMMKPAFPDMSVNINKSNENTSKQTPNNDYKVETKNQVPVKAKSSARESDDILTGKKKYKYII